MRHFQLGQELRDHTQNRPSSVQHGISDDAHDADPAAPKYQTDASPSEAMTKGAPGTGIDRVHADSGATKHGERTYSRHKYPSI